MESMFTQLFGYSVDYSPLVQTITGMASLAVIGGTSALFLTHFSRKFKNNAEPAVEKINKMLPQTQCAQCGFPGCLPYAEAIINGEAINLCPPGGQETVQAIAELLGRDAPLLENDTRLAPKTVARIREAECIGCTLCLPACPVDAIIGAPQLMHTVIEQTCTGCDLCLEPCPVDCIDIVTIDEHQTIGVHNPLQKQTQSTTQATTQLTTQCIRCDACESRCPRDLAPQALYWAKNSLDTLLNLDLHNCIECKLCDRVCPANIPLTQIFIDAKDRVRRRETETKEAEDLQARFQKHQLHKLDRRDQLRSRPGKSDRSAILQTLVSGNSKHASSGENK